MKRFNYHSLKNNCRDRIKFKIYNPHQAVCNLTGKYFTIGNNHNATDEGYYKKIENYE